MTTSKKVAKVALTFVGMIIAFGFLVIIAGAANKAHAAPKSEVLWNNWGAAPYASSQDDACKKASVAIDGFGDKMPRAVKDHFKGVACKGGTEEWLVPHKHLEEMWSGGKKPHVVKNVTVAEIPVTSAPSGRAYRKGAVAETVKVKMWTYEYEGMKYVLYLPAVCGNWAWAYGNPEQCAQVKLTVPAGTSRSVRSTLIREKPIDSFNCWGVVDNGVATGAPRNCDTCEWATSSPTNAVNTMNVDGGSRKPQHTSIYNVRTSEGSSEVTLVYPLSARDEGVAVCVEVDGAVHKTALVRPSAWKGNTRVTIPADFWANPRPVNTK